MTTPGTIDTPDQGRRAARATLWLIVGSMTALMLWASLTEIDEVAVGPGKVVPSGRSMLIQTLEPGTLKALRVREGDVVERGQHVATLDPVRAESAVGEAEARIDALQARAARLEAESRGASKLVVPEGVTLTEASRSREQAALTTNQRSFRGNIAAMESEIALARQELATIEPFLASGATNSIEVLKIRQKIAELTTRISAARSQYFVGIREELSQTIAELTPLLEVRTGRLDQLQRTIMRSPARGIVNDIRITTIGGVVPAGGELMEIVPLDDSLLVETRISPRDVAFIHPAQQANVKITAFDSSIYGALPAVVERVSADSLRDETDQRVQYYRVYIRTQKGYVQAKNGRRYPIIPGMVTQTEIRTGRRTIMSYLLKPLNKAAEALRER